MEYISSQYLIALLDEIDITAEVDSEPDDSSDSGVHTLAVAPAGEDGDPLATVGVSANQPTTHLGLSRPPSCRCHFTVSCHPVGSVTSKCP